MKWLTVAAIVFAGALASCSSPEPSQHKQYEKLSHEVGRIIEQVRQSTGPELYSHLNRLIAYDVFAIDPVAEQLAVDPNPRLRSNAMFILASIKDEHFPSAQQKILDLLHRGLNDPHKLVRLEAASGLAARNDWSVLPVLLDGLEDSRPVVRYNCHQTLMTVTSEDFGYLVDAPETERKEAIARWRAWYKHWDSDKG